MAVTQVKIIQDEEVEGVAADVFQNFKDKHGMVPNWVRVMANRPEILATFAQHLSVVMGPGLVEQDNKWKCAYAVSKINKCTYCVGVVDGMLKKLGVPDEHIADVITDDKTSLNPDEQAAVRYAEAATTHAAEVPEDIIVELKKHYDDAQIVELTGAIGLFNYVNRFNDALGVLPEVG